MRRSILTTCAILAVLWRAAVADDKPFGIERRVPWTGSKITGSPSPPSPYRIRPAAAHLKFENPTELVAVPGTNRLMVVQLDGKLFTFDPMSDKPADLAADLSTTPNYARAYGLAFPPDFATNRVCYVCYVLTPKIADGSRVSRFKVTRDDPPKIDLSSEEVVLTWVSGGHNGGSLQFGPDGMLYVSTGDGGESFPPDGLQTGQDLDDLLACILRIDVNKPAGELKYSIPADNPFAATPGARGEIWAYGLRNPWKMSFDRERGDLWVGDVGWELWELVYRVERGANYGWSLVEGPQPVHGERQRGPTPIVAPTAAHSHTEARSITGGFVYRGSRLPELKGAYVYGDYVTGKMWGLRHDGKQVTSIAELVDTTLQIVCFGEDAAGELYVVDYLGTLHQLEPNPAAGQTHRFPQKLSETGLFASVAEHRLASGVLPFDVNAAMWADGATAARFVALPGSSTLGMYEKEEVQAGRLKGAWKFPADGVLGKTISLELKVGDPGSSRRMETQILHFTGEDWQAYTYLWNDAQTDASLVGPQSLDVPLTIVDPAAPGGKRSDAYHVAARTECLLCHTTRAGTLMGFLPEQLNRDFDYSTLLAKSSSAAAPRIDNQLRTFAHIDLFEQPVAQHVPLADPYDASASLESRARAYLHVNCGHCHRRGGGGSAAFDVRFSLPLEKTNLLAARPTQGTFNMLGAQLVAPGDPSHSVVSYRLSKLGRGRMPYFGAATVDRDGVKLINEWIASLPVDPATPAAKQAAAEELAVSRLRQATSPGERDQLLDQLLASTSGSLRLQAAISDAPPTDDFAQQAVRRAAAHADPIVRDLFERFLPEDQRQKRLGVNFKPEDILSLAGDASRGRELFLVAAGVQCRNCHRLAGQGKEIGPDLDAIGKKLAMPQLLESLLEPSKAIDPKYLAQLVETKDGRVLTGLLMERGAEGILLRDAQGKEHRVPSNEIEVMAPQRLSLMPEMQLRDLTAQQAADLLAFLAQQQGPQQPAAAPAAADQAAVETRPVEGQPLGASVLRLVEALEFLGTPLAPSLVKELKAAAEARDSQRMQQLLDSQVLLVVHINPESRVKVERGPARARIQQAGYTPVLVKVLNDSTITQPLRIASPQAGAVYAGEADLSMNRQRQLQLKSDELANGEKPSRPDRGRFLQLEMFHQPPMTKNLGGLAVEYAVALVYSTEAGMREATISFDVGQGNQDLGFRGEAPVLFDVRPAVAVKLKVKDVDGRPTVGRFTFKDAAGQVYPAQAKRLAPDFFFQQQIYRADGQIVLLPPGELTMQASRGPEYRTLKRQVTIPPGETYEIAVQLERWIDPASHGYFSGDHHIHAAGCAHYTCPTEGVLAEDMFLQVKGEGLNVGCVLTWGPCYDYQRQFFSPAAHQLSEPLTLLKYDVEVSGFGSQALGHVCLLNLKDQTYPGSAGTKTKGWPTWTAPVLKWAKEQKAVVGYAHSASGLQVDAAAAAKRQLAALDANGDGLLSAAEAEVGLLTEPFAKIDADKSESLSIAELVASTDRACDRLPNLAIPEMNGVGAQEVCVTTALGLCDFISSMDSARLLEWNCWYHVLNCGFPLRTSGETDFPCMSSTRVGQGRVYANLGQVESVDFAAWCQAIANGRSYVSDGYAHALDFQVNGEGSGGTLQPGKPGKVQVTANVAFASQTPLGSEHGGVVPARGLRVVGDTVVMHEPLSPGQTFAGERKVELIVNGVAVAERTIPADDRLHEIRFDVPVERSSWLALRQFPQLHTNPVSVEVGGKPIRASKASARWCIDVIEQLWRARGKTIAANERPAARDAYDQALAIYRAIEAESP